MLLAKNGGSLRNVHVVIGTPDAVAEAAVAPNAVPILTAVKALAVDEADACLQVCEGPCAPCPVGTACSHHGLRQCLLTADSRPAQEAVQSAPSQNQQLCMFTEHSILTCSLRYSCFFFGMNHPMLSPPCCCCMQEHAKSMEFIMAETCCQQGWTKPQVVFAGATVRTEACALAEQMVRLQLLFRFWYIPAAP